MTIKFSSSNRKNLNNIQLVTLVISANSHSINSIITLSTNDYPIDQLHNYFLKENISWERLFLYKSTINTISYEGLCYYLKKEPTEFFLSDLTSNFNIFDFSKFNSKIEKKVINIKKNYYVYMLRCIDNSIYTGIATDYKKRFEKHISQEGAKYTKNRLPTKIERVWKIEGRSSASKIEYYIKSLNKKQKEDLLLNPLSLNTLFSKTILEL